MNRRRVLQSASVIGSVALAGCLGSVQEHFEGSVQGVVPIEIHSETDQTHNLQLAGRERETGRESYDQEIAVGPGETVGPPHLDATEQSFRVVSIDAQAEDEIDVQEVSITEDTQLVLIWLYDDEIVLEADRGDGDETDDETDDLEGPEEIDDADDNRSAGLDLDDDTDDDDTDDDA